VTVDPFTIPLGQARILREGRDVTLVGWGQQVWPDLHVMKSLVVCRTRKAVVSMLWSVHMCHLSTTAGQAALCKCAKRHNVICHKPGSYHCASVLCVQDTRLCFAEWTELLCRWRELVDLGNSYTFWCLIFAFFTEIIATSTASGRLEVNLFKSEKRGGMSHFGIILVSPVLGIWRFFIACRSLLPISMQTKQDPR